MDRHNISLGLLFLRLIGGTLLITGRAWSWQTMIESNRATMTQIARNLAPSGRYEYDARTGGYDRYVPYF
jgi:hypothetical protein